MDDLKTKRGEIRSRNLRILKDELFPDRGGKADFAMFLGIAEASTSGYLRGSKYMGEIVARRIEKMCNKPPFWLDTDHGHIPTSSDRVSPETQNGTTGLTLLQSSKRVPVMYTCQFKASEWATPQRFNKSPGKYVEYPIDFGRDAFVVVNLGSGLGPSFQNEQALIVTPCGTLTPRAQYILEQSGAWKLAVFTGNAEYVDGSGNFVDLGDGSAFVCEKSRAILKIRAIVTPDEIKNA
jgi:hypothetical protein